MIQLSKSIHNLGETGFQDFCSSLLLELLGLGFNPGSRGKDGGRDATYEGKIQIPNTTSSFYGNWNFQIKFHDKDHTSQQTWHQKPIQDLNNELKKFENRDHEFDGYLFITNVDLTWVKEQGTYDKIMNTIKPKFEAVGFKNFLIFDGNKLEKLFPLILKTVEFFLTNESENKGISHVSLCNEDLKANKVIEVICDFFDNQTFQQNNKSNFHFTSQLTWKYRNLSFYLYTLSSENNLQIAKDISKRLFSNEILCLYGSGSKINRLFGKFEFIPLPNDLNEKEIKQRLINYKNYIDRG
ncbi:MAG: hypothetical protein HeimC3_53770 [Candidatus Heimdallarchaeota archaeon LC_3]|nr:MAG: hypothetical protein HeimC3_53770 [Candidatus Heimdallarchaeota archaeon LC_3]